jgi:transcriptional regulator with XRE-family HTH domain
VVDSDVRTLRAKLRVSRAELARYLGVSEATVTRWEATDDPSEPKGLQAVLLRALLDATDRHPPDRIGRLIRSCGIDHRAALKALLHAANGEEPPQA